MFCLSCVFLRTDPSRLARFWSCSSCSLLSKTSYFLFPQLLTHIRSRQIYLTFYENFINLTHLLASSRPPRSLSALLTGQLWNRLIIIGLGRWWNGPGVVGVGVRLPVHAALLPPLAPVEHPEVARRTQRRVRVVLALQTLVTRLIGKIFLYYIKIFWKFYSYYTCVMSPWATTPPCSSAAAASSEECAGTAAPITLPPVKLYHQSSLSPNPDPEYTQSRVIKVKFKCHSAGFDDISAIY